MRGEEDALAGPTEPEHQPDIAESGVKEDSVPKGPTPWIDDSHLRGELEKIVTEDNAANMTFGEAKLQLASSLQCTVEQINEHRADCHQILKIVSSEVSNKIGEKLDEMEAAIAAPRGKKRASSSPSASAKRKKTESAVKVSRKEWMNKAPHVKFKFHEVEQALEPKSFSSGSLGYGAYLTVEVDVEGQKIPLRVTLNCVATGSKNWRSGSSDSDKGSVSDKG